MNLTRNLIGSVKLLGQSNFMFDYSSAFNVIIRMVHQPSNSFLQASLRNVEAETYALIQYLGSKETLTVMTDIENDGEWKPCLAVSGVRLPTSYHIGLSAATGDLAGVFAIAVNQRLFILIWLAEIGHVTKMFFPLFFRQPRYNWFKILRA